MYIAYMHNVVFKHYTSTHHNTLQTYAIQLYIQGKLTGRELIKANLQGGNSSRHGKLQHIAQTENLQIQARNSSWVQVRPS